jgi:tetratricopeptide (TPR) repeat protein
MILCTSAGLNVSGVMTKDHAFVMVHISGQNIDVETTNIHGFDPGSRKEFNDQISGITGFAYVPAQNYRDRQTIGQMELISLIMNNRIAELEKQNRYADAVPIAVDRAAFLSGNVTAVSKTTNPGSIFSDPRQDMMDRHFNYGAMLLKAGREEDCLRWAATVIATYPQDTRPADSSGEDRWQEFILAAANNRIIKFTRANQRTQARNFLESHKALLSPVNYLQLDATLVDSELLDSANKIRTAVEGASVIEAIDEARTKGRIVEKRAAEILTFAILKTASVLSAAPGRDWRAAIEFIQASIDRFGANRELEQSLQSYQGNLAADYHNRFAAAWNNRNFDEAERILNEGLAEFPDNRQLLANRETVNRQRQ